MNKYNCILRIRDTFRSNLLKYTRQAFSFLPPLSNPRILDIGCGSGVATIELAKLTEGHIEAIDIDQIALDEFKKQVSDINLQDRIKIIQGSMLESDFDPDSFDLIWSEGSIAFIGFRNGLERWRKFLKANGYLVVHDSVSDLSNKEKLITECGFSKLGQFIISHEMWWNEYFGPLKNRLDSIKDVDDLSADEKKELESAREEVDGFDYSDDNYASVFFILQKS